MPVPVRRGPVLTPWLEDEYNRAPPPPDTGGSWQSIIDTYATGFWGAAKDRVEETLVRNRTRQPDYDALDHIPQGYEHYAEAFMWAKSPEEVDAIRANLDDMELRKVRLAQNGMLENIGYGLVAGVLDPVNLIGGPTLKGIGFVRGALLGGAAYGSINAGQELARNAIDPTVTDEETLINVGFGYAFAGLISGGSGALGKARGPGALPKDTVKRFDEVGDGYGKAWAASEGKPVTELIDFEGQGVRIVDGPTGKTDGQGNPVRAFFRPKEAVEAVRAREAQAKAVDDALGPVIPEEAAPVRLVDDAVEAVDDTVVPLRDEVDDDLPPWTIDEMDELAEATPIRSPDDPLEDRRIAVGETPVPPDAPRPIVRLVEPDEAEAAVAQRSVDEEPETPPWQPAPTERTTPIAREDLAQAVDRTIASELDDASLSQARDHYGVDGNELRSRLLDDAFLAITEGIDKVAEAVRALVKRIVSSVLAAAMVINPAALAPAPAGLFKEADFAAVRVMGVRMIPETARGEMSADAASVFGQVAGLAERKGRAFIIVDKNDGRVHIFAKGGEHLGSADALTGKSRLDELPAERLSTTTIGEIAAIGDSARVTPAGLRTAKAKVAEGQSVPSLFLRGLDGRANMIAFHVNNSIGENRVGRLASKTGDDNAITFGCVTTSPTFWNSHVAGRIDELDGAVVFIMPHERAKTNALLPRADEGPASLPLRSGKDDNGDLAALPAREERRSAQAMRRDPKDPDPRTSEGIEPKATDDIVDADVEDTIYVDSEGLRADFENKPWTAPRYEGIEPMAEDAFQTPQEWVNFVVLHELHHKTTKRNAGESKADYENRVNRLAYEEMKAGRLPLSPTDGALEKLMLLPTPSGTLMRLAPRHAPTHELAQGMAGDMSTLTIANKAGLPTTPGGSVFQLAHRWLYGHYVHTLAWRRAYVEYVKGAAAGSDGLAMVQASLAAVPRFGSAARQGKLKLDEFRRVYGRAMNTDEPFPNTLTEGEMAIVRKYAAESRKVLVKFEVEARSLGMFDALRRVQREIDWRTRRNTEDAETLAKLGKGKPGLQAHIRGRIAEREAELADLAAELEELRANPVKPAREDHYWPRIFDIKAIRDRFDDFVELVAEGYRRDGNPNALEAARATAERIIGRGGDEATFGTGSGRHLRSRQIPLSNNELADFIVWDADVVMGIYARRMGAAIEMTRKYGSTMAEEHLDRLETALVRDGFDAKKRVKILHEIEDMRDRVLGRFHASDPLNWQNRAARAIKNYGSLTLMGRGIYAQVVDVVRTLAAEGYAPLFKAMGAAFDNRKLVSARGKYSRQAGEGLELVMARWQAMVMENDSALMVTQQSGIERGLAAAQAPFFALNLMNPFTVVWKDFTSLMSGHTLIADSVRIAEAVRSGKTLATMSKAEQKLVARMASWGIDLRAAQLIADMPFEKTEGTGLYLANLEAWEGRAGERAREAFMGALSGKIRSNVITPGPLQRAAIMDGVFRVNGERVELPLLSLPFQLMSFSMSASAKVSHAVLSGRDPKPLVTVSALLAGGYVSAWLAAGDRWDQMSWQERAYNALDRSGLFGWLVDVSRRMDTLAGVGPRSALGFDEFGEDTVSDEIGAVLGPAPGVIAGAFEAFIDNDLTTSQRAGMVRRAVPFTGLVQVNEFFKWIQQVVVGEIEDGGGLDVAELPVEEAA